MRNGRGGYQAEMIGRRGWGRGGNGVMGAIGQLQDAAAAGDARAKEMCDALQNAGCGVPPWDRRVLAPGINAPCDDLFPLPMRPIGGTPTFVNAGPTTITWQARSQKPFRAERPLVRVVRVGAGAANITPVIRGGFTVGTAPQIAQKADQPIEDFVGNNFGVRMLMTPCEPGIDIEADIVLIGPALAAGETITVFITLFGSVWA